MADDDIQSQGLQQPNEPSFSAVEQGAATAGLAAALAAIAAGAIIRVQELAALADRFGKVHIDVDSTAIRALDYSITTGAMAVTFTDGSVYPYPPVSVSNFLAFVNARSGSYGSIGRFYNFEVRGRWG